MNARPSLVVAALLTLAGCAQTPSQPAPPPTPEPRDLAPIEYDGETLGDLLVAESAAQRQSLGVTLAYYGRAAETTHDPEVISQATKLATYLDQPQKARHLAGLWLAREPANADALRLAALADIQLGNSDGAAGFIDRLLADHGSEALLPLVAEASSLSDNDNQQLLKALSQLADRYPEQAPLWYARALDLRQQGDLPGAMAAVKHARDQDPKHMEAALLEARLLFESGEHKKALRRAQAQVKAHPQNRRPRLAYVRLLLASGQRDQAQEQLTVLAEQHPEDLDLRYSLALIALEAGANDSARSLLSDLLQRGYRPNEMRLRLAQVAEAAGDTDQAIDDYLKVKGADALEAKVQAARLLYQSDRPDRAHGLITQLAQQYPGRANQLWITEAEMRKDQGDNEGALALLGKALEGAPDNSDLLYARAMTAGALGHHQRMEADLERLLELHPDDAGALNALGYTWADRGVHLDKAEAMIRRALEQYPRDPAILDSMGWVLYRQGQLDEALGYLRRAHALMPDPEVSAHLGEVLWALGDKESARAVWSAALAAQPDSAIVRDTLKRLEVTL